MRRIVFLVTSLALAGSLISGPAQANVLTLSERHDTAHALQWTGMVERPATTIDGALPEDAPSGTDARSFKVSIGSAKKARVTTWILWDSSEDLDVAIKNAAGSVVDSGSAGPGDPEVVTYDVENGKTYTVTVSGALNANTSFTAYTWIRSLSGRSFSGPGKLKYAKKDLFTTIDVPINIVFVGFDAAEVAEQKARVLKQIPPAFRPVIRIGAFNGGLGVPRRELNRKLHPELSIPATAMEYEPIEYRYKPRIITASESWTKQMFAAAKAATTSGDYQLPFDRDFVERYNARAGALRGPSAVVAPKTDVDFIDGFKLEDWVAAHPPAGLNFDLRKPANGYTYFVMDSFRPSYAGQYFNTSRYHNFRIMNQLTTDPDSGLQNGVDWARVWGGRYRFLMLDVGAAPNSWEADAAVANTRNFRVAGNGDSSKHDPPIWHYRDAPADPSETLGLPNDVAVPAEPLDAFYDRIGEDVQSAIFMRFTRGYLYRPRAYEKFILAANTWHDADAYTPWPSKLEGLYKDKVVLQAYKSLIPYADWTGFSTYKYLAKGDPEQDAIDAGKERSLSGLPVAGAVNPHPMMNLVNRNRAKYAPIKPGSFTIPVINVVFQSLYTWAGLPFVTGGIAQGEDEDPWGQIQNVNDRTKTYSATGTVTDSKGVTHAPVVPDARKNAIETVPGGIDNVGRFGFTSTALHEAGHFLGLSHTHDAVFYDWRQGGNSGDPSKPTGYYNTIDWMYTTTASPMGYGWEYNKFEVLDKDNIWIGHTLEWLQEAQDGLADSYAALDSKRITRLTPAVAKQKAVVDRLVGASVAALRNGRYLDAVKSAIAAKRAAAATVATAAKTVVPKARSKAITRSSSPSTRDDAALAAASEAAPTGGSAPLAAVAVAALSATALLLARRVAPALARRRRR